MKTPLTATMSRGVPNIYSRITPQPLSHTSEHLTSDIRYWVKIMRTLLTATMS